MEQFIFSLEYILAIIAILVITVIFYYKEKPIRNFILGISVLGTLAVITILISFLKENINLSYLLVLSSGYTAIIILMFVLLIGPMARLTKSKFWKKMLANRRNIGVSVFIFGFFHYLSNWNSTFNWNPKLLQLLADPNTNYGRGLISGLCALVIFGVVALVSNQFSIKKLGRKFWKWIQLTSYLALVLVVFHVILLGSLFQEFIILRILFLTLFIFVVAIKIVDIVILKKKKINR